MAPGARMRLTELQVQTGQRCRKNKRNLLQLRRPCQERKAASSSINVAQPHKY